MKTLTKLILGLASSAFLTCGLVRAAQICTPQKSTTVTIQSSQPAVCCVTPCAYVQD